MCHILHNGVKEGLKVAGVEKVVENVRALAMNMRRSKLAQEHFEKVQEGMSIDARNILHEVIEADAIGVECSGATSSDRETDESDGEADGQEGGAGAGGRLAMRGQWGC